jgi:hypothetical protein
MPSLHPMIKPPIDREVKLIYRIPYEIETDFIIMNVNPLHIPVTNLNLAFLKLIDPMTKLLIPHHQYGKGKPRSEVKTQS